MLAANLTKERVDTLIESLGITGADAAELSKAIIQTSIDLASSPCDYERFATEMQGAANIMDQINASYGGAT